MYRWDDWSLSIRIGGMNDLAVPLFPRFFNFGMMAITLIDKKTADCERRLDALCCYPQARGSFGAVCTAINVKSC